MNHARLVGGAAVVSCLALSCYHPAPAAQVEGTRKTARTYDAPAPSALSASTISPQLINNGAIRSPEWLVWRGACIAVHVHAEHPMQLQIRSGAVTLYGARTPDAWQLDHAKWSPFGNEVVVSACSAQLVLSDGAQYPAQLVVSAAHCASDSVDATESAQASAKAEAMGSRERLHCLELLSAPWPSYVNTQSPSAELAQLTQHERTFYWRLDVEAQAGHCQAWTLHPSKALRNWGTLTASYVQGERRVVQERSFAIVRNALHVYAGSLKVSDDTTQTSERLSQWRVYYFEPGQSPYTTGLWHPSASECSQ